MTWLRHNALMIVIVLMCVASVPSTMYVNSVLQKSVVFQKCVDMRRKVYINGTIEWARTIAAFESEYRLRHITEKDFYRGRARAFKVYLVLLDVYQNMKC